MSLTAGLAIPVVLATAFGGAFMVNEWSHGAMAEAAGMGHRHMLDYAGVHCAAHDGAQAGAHAAHMHGNATMPHGQCAGGAAMHGQGTMAMPMPMGPDAAAMGGRHA